MPGRRPAVIAAAVLVLCAALYGGAWLVAADMLRGAVEDWVAARRAEGWTVTHGAVAVAGFPFALEARIAGPRMSRSAADGERAWRGPPLTVTFLPWRPRRIRLSAPGTHHVTLPWRGAVRAAEIAARGARAAIDLDAAGRAGRLALDLDGARVAALPGGPDTTAGKLHLALAAPVFVAGPDPPPHQRPSLRLEAEARAVTLPAEARAALGRSIERLALTASVLGRIAGRNLVDGLASWRDGGGTIEIERLEVGWGALGISADGTLALDAALQPEAALAARITGLGETVDVLAGAGAVRASDAVSAKIVLGLLAKTPDGGGKPVVSAPLAVQNGRLYIGPVPLLRLPPIRWD